ncbi:MAG: Holliday junction resolvase RuvX [Crocinitomicaceae bacterium]|nr:Holliday junction resolvase RuvX [Crocinitomicaceae bacterium]MDP4866434.1 Holliday junction resolvase RuvX [Crocinitomicaceae bacterium]
MGKILAIDFGMKRTGLAITDSSNIIASPLETVDTQNLMNRLAELVEKEKISTIVLGEPKNLDSSDTHITQNVRLLKEALEKKFETVKIVSVDERFTSKMAFQSMIDGGMKKKQRQEKGTVDKVSAAIILQSYLAQITR